MSKLLTSLFIAALLLGLYSCSIDEDSFVPASRADVELTLSPYGGEELLNLPGFSQPLSVTLENTSWLSYETEENADGVAIRFKATNPAPAEIRTQSVTISDTSGHSCVVKVSQAVNMSSEYNAEDVEFLTDWENQDTVKLYSNGAFRVVNTPWNPQASATTLPDIICNDVKKADGWEMAFSTVGISSLEGSNYFGLYNKYTGILRIFYYVHNAATEGSKYCLEVDMGSKKQNVKFPFYNALEYSIPSSHTALDQNVDLLNLKMVSTTFKTFVTPHSLSSSQALTVGWTAFDLDASGFCPSGYDWKKTQETLTLQIKTSSESLITLCGGLTAGISGNFSQIEETTVSTSSGPSKLFKQIGKGAGAASKPAGAITKLLFGTDISGTVNTIAGVSNFLGSLTEKIYSGYTETAVDSMAGRIELNMTGDINLDGKIKADASNNCPPLAIHAQGFRDSHFGEGVWGLAKDPVVYLVGDHVLGDVSRFNLTCLGGGAYGAPVNADENIKLRMITFLDPESIVLNLNPNVFGDATDIEVVGANFGVYPDEEAGHTATYRSLLGLKTPGLALTSASSGAWKSVNPANTVKYSNIPIASTLSAAIGEKDSNCSLIEQKGANYKYYGNKLDLYGRTFIQNPQILFPYTYSGNEAKLYDAQMPDLVVTVVVRFKSGGKIYTMGQRFLPEIKVITGSDVKTKLTALKNYKSKCDNKQGINSVNGKTVRHTTGQATVERAISILSEITK